MSKKHSATATRYLEHNVSERYEDTAERIHKAYQGQLSQRNPTDLHLGPYLIVANAKTPSQGSAKLEFSTSSVCIIL